MDIYAKQNQTHRLNIFLWDQKQGKYVCSHHFFSRVQLFVTLCTVASQTPQSSQVAQMVKKKKKKKNLLSMQETWVQSLG